MLPWLIIGIAALMGYARMNIDLSLKTVVATQTICTFPLVTAIVSAQLFRFERVQEEAAIDLGCSRLQVLLHIILPHIFPALAAAAIFAFTWSFNNYEISAFTLGFQETFPVWVYSSVRDPEHTAIVNAISTLISAVQVVHDLGRPAAASAWRRRWRHAGDRRAPSWPPERRGPDGDGLRLARDPAGGRLRHGRAAAAAARSASCSLR